jgi:hypothetical protein
MQKFMRQIALIHSFARVNHINVTKIVYQRASFMVVIVSMALLIVVVYINI